MRIKSKIVPLLLAGFAVAAVVWITAPVVPAWSRLRGPMVQMPHAAGFSLVWTRPATESAQVTVRQDDGDWHKEFAAAASGDQFEARIDGLEPGTFYTYEILFPDGRGPLLTGRTRTAPATDGAFRFIAFGDSGSGDQNQRGLAKLMVKEDPDLVVHTGDLVYPSGAASDYPAKFYEPYADLLKRAAFMACVGNHDWGDFQAEPMFDAFVLPANGPEGATPERHYWFVYGDACFVCLDSDATFEELRTQVAPWLDAVLSGAGDRWKVVYFHHPPYTAGKYQPSGKVRNLLVPLFDRYGVHLVLTGHNHMYERSRPIRNGEVVESGEGTVYVVSGAGGGALHKPRGPLPETLVQRIPGVFSFTVIDVEPTALSLRQIALSGAVIDTCTIQRWPTSTSGEIDAETGG